MPTDNLSSDHFWRFVQVNLTMGCPKCTRPSHTIYAPVGKQFRGYANPQAALQDDKQPVWSDCRYCRGTGRVPRPEAIELLEVLEKFITCSCDEYHRRLSPAEQHVAAQSWWLVGKAGIELPRLKYIPDADEGHRVRLSWLGGTRTGERLFEGLEAALVASGWTALEE